MMFYAIFATVLVIILTMAGLCWYLNQYDLPKLDLNRLIGKKGPYRILAIYPHPDDETMSVGGFLTTLASDANNVIKAISLTKGEKGDEKLKLSPQKLGEVRKQEFQQVMQILGVREYEVWDFPDGGVEENYTGLKQQISFEIQDFKPDLILTYESDGIYGHPDHISGSKAVYEVAGQLNNPPKLLFSTLPKNLLRHVRLPLHMSNGKVVRQSPPKFRHPHGRQLVRKYRAGRSYKSQKLNHNGPMWLLFLLLNNEYFTDEYD